MLKKSIQNICICFVWQIFNKYCLNTIWLLMHNSHCLWWAVKEGTEIEWTEWMGWFLKWNDCKGRGWGRHKALQFIVLKEPTALLGGRWKWSWEEESDRWYLGLSHSLSLLRVAPFLPLLGLLPIAFINWDSTRIYTHTVTLDSSIQRKDTTWQHFLSHWYYIMLFGA